MKTLLLSRYLILSILVIMFSQVNATAAEDEHTPLGEQMEQIGRAWRMVKRGASDPAKNAQTLAEVKKMQAAAKASMKFGPALLKEVRDAEKEKFLNSYSKGMKSFSEKLDKLSRLLEAGDNEAATVLIADIDEHRKMAHETFKVPE